MSEDTRFERRTLMKRRYQPIAIPLRVRGELLGVAKDARDAFGETGPALLLVGELSLASGSQYIEPRLTILLGRPPVSLDPSVLFHSVECRIERAFFHAQQVRGRALDVGRDGVPVHAALAGQSLEHEEAEGALQDVVALSWRHERRG